MTETGEPAWRLDSLDSVGGLAFASYRISEIEAGVLNAGIPAVFVGAPTFQPINLTSRSVGLAATRQTFQSGLFIKGEEAGFADLEDAIEFVRRCYVGGGGGMGGAPGGGPPLPPEGGPDFPAGPGFEGTGVGEELHGEEIRLTDIFHADLQKYSALSMGLDSRSPGQSFLMTWNPPPDLPVSSGFPRTARTPSIDGAEVLVRGATRVVDEMLRRVPTPSTYQKEFIDWLLAFDRLVVAISRMGICSLQWERHHRHFSRMYQALRHFAERRNEALLLKWLDSRYGVIPDFPWSTGMEWTDAIDDLQIWPIPSRVARTLSSSANHDNPTLLNFLSSFLANPPAVNGSPLTVPEIDVALFAAARIIAPCAHIWGHAFHLHVYPPADTLCLPMALKLADAAWVWLAGQLPRRGFGPGLEQAIRQTSTLVFA